MSRFAQAASFAMPPAGDMNTQSRLLRNAAPMDPYAAAMAPGAPVGAPGESYGPDPYAGFAPGGLPSGPGTAGGAGMDPYGGGLSGGGFPPPGAAPPGLLSDPYASSAGPAPLPGAPPDPYAMTSFAGASPPGFSPAPSSAISDPYAPGGSFAPRGSPRSGLQVPHFRGMQSHGGAVGSPKSLPKWLRWLAVGALIFIVGAVVLHMMRRGAAAPTPPPPRAAPPVPSCPPMPAACPPVAPAVPAKPEEITLRLAKDDVPIKVQVQGLRPEDSGHEGRSRPEEPHRRRETDDDSRAPREQGPRNGTGRPVPPVVIVNEAQPSATPVPDLWELSYAGNSGAALPRMGDTNMVYTRVGGPL